MPGTKIGISSPGGWLPAAARIGRVRLAVSDLEESVSFYRDVIGLTVLATETSNSDGPVASLGTHGSGRVLLELQQLAHVKPLQQRRLGLYHTAFLLPNRAELGSFVQHLSALGVPFGSADHLFSEAIYLVDPDGLTVEVYADRDRATWVYEGGQLIGATKPLNLSELSRSARRAWQGAPKATTVGHLHFYVNDLDQAKLFYHMAMGLDMVTWNFPGALFLSAGGYHHHIGLNTWAAGSPVASREDARLLFWELVLPDDRAVVEVSSRLRAFAHGPAFHDAQGISVVLKSEVDTK